MRKMRWMLAPLLLSIVLSVQIQAKAPDTVIPAMDLAPMKFGSYDWFGRHDAVVDRVKQGKVDLILVGDSITNGLGGPPDKWSYGGPGGLWDKFFGSRNAVNLGFGWDKTQHVLWRFNHGEIDGIKPKVAVVMIGTNNMGSDTSPEIAMGVTAVVDQLQTKLPGTKVLLLAIFPRGNKPDDKNRMQVAEVNKLIAPLGKRKGVTYMDFSAKFLDADGTLSKDVMPDFLHPNAKGYDIWTKEMEPTLAKLMGDKPRM
ncbi:hypothetical protein BH11ARM1_BH11ARM1_05860 [soil metagenome]